MTITSTAFQRIRYGECRYPPVWFHVGVDAVCSRQYWALGHLTSIIGGSDLKAEKGVKGTKEEVERLQKKNKIGNYGVHVRWYRSVSEACFSVDSEIMARFPCSEDDCQSMYDGGGCGRYVCVGWGEQRGEGGALGQEALSCMNLRVGGTKSWALGARSRRVLIV
jgi:hypothetical protein